MLLGVGFRLLRLRDVPVGDLLPALVVAPLLVALVRLSRSDLPCPAADGNDGSLGAALLSGVVSARRGHSDHVLWLGFGGHAAGPRPDPCPTPCLPNGGTRVRLLLALVGLFLALTVAGPAAALPPAGAPAALLPATASAEPTAEPSAAPSEEAGPEAINVRVRDDETRENVEGVAVTVSSDGEVVGEGETDADGACPSPCPVPARTRSSSTWRRCPRS